MQHIILYHKVMIDDILYKEGICAGWQVMLQLKWWQYNTMLHWQHETYATIKHWCRADPTRRCHWP